MTTITRYADPVAQKEIDRLRAGEDRTPIDPAAWPTPGQAWAQLLDADVETRLLILEAAIEARRANNVRVVLDRRRRDDDDRPGGLRVIY